MNTTYLPGFGDAATWGPVMDPRDPRFEDDGCWSEEEADDIAKEEALATPYSWAYFLMETIDNTEPVKTYVSSKADWLASDLSNDQLLALVMDCSDWDIVREAREELRDRFLEFGNTKEQIRERSEELQQEIAE